METRAMPLTAANVVAAAALSLESSGKQELWWRKACHRCMLYLYLSYLLVSSLCNTSLDIKIEIGQLTKDILEPIFITNN